jgi:hypothetical protein
MSLCREQLFENVTQSVYDALMLKVKDKLGIVITGAQGQESAQGYTVAYKFNADTEILSLQCLAAPRPERWFPSKIESAVAQLVQESLPK